MKTVEIIVPYYSKSENIRPLYGAIEGVFTEKLPAYSYALLFVNNGSSDGSFVVLKKLLEEDKRVKYLSFSHNFDYRLTVKAGLDHSFAGAVILMGCNQQHPPALIPELVKRWEEGNQMVTTLRTYPPNTPKEGRKSSHHFYKLLNMLSDIEIKGGSADFRLLDQEVVEVIREVDENEPFLRGIVSWVGFKQYYIPYTTRARFVKESKYTIEKMLHLATTGVASFSVKPLCFAVFLSFAFSTLSVFYIPYVVYAFVSGAEVSGWASLIVMVAFFGGLQLIILGIVGTYIGKIFRQTKARPAYIIQEGEL